MKTVTKTELNQRPSEVMKLVEAGEVVKITLRGTVVARIVPEPTSDSPIERLIDAGLVVPARNPRRLEPGKPRVTVEEARAILAETRAEASER